MGTLPMRTGQKRGGVGAHIINPMDFGLEALGYLGRMGQMEQIIPIDLDWRS